MRKYIMGLVLVIVSVALTSWGFKGHRAVATIAKNHLSTNAFKVVQAYLGGETMADASTWADENKIKETEPWHYIDLPSGLSHEQFTEAVTKQGNDNIYTAILRVEAILKDVTSTPGQKNEALKYLIHLVGDAHQPMHVSRKEDKGGNTIQLQFDSKGTNLHSLWDSKLIEYEGLSESVIVKQYDWANDAQIKKWQADSPLQWLWESYQISNELYEDIKPGQKIDEAYYKKYIQTIHLRIDQAGIRLAGELNKLFTDIKIKAVTAKLIAPQSSSNSVVPFLTVRLEDVKDAVGKNVTVTGKVFSSKDIGIMVLINLGAAYPNQLLTIALKGEAKQLSAQLTDKIISVQGLVTDYKGKPEIVITEKSKILNIK